MEQQHAIGKLLLEVRLPSRDDAFSLQGSLSTRCNEELAPMLSALLDSWTDPDTLLQIDKLEIDLGSCNINTLQKELPELVIDYLRKNYQSISTDIPSAGEMTGVQRRPLTHGYFDTWLYFLKNGVLPATAVKWQQDDWEAGILSALSSETFAVNKCRALFAEYPYAAKRLVLQFSRSFVHNWVLAYGAETYRPLLQQIEDWQAHVYHPQTRRQLQELQSVLPAVSSAALLHIPEKEVYLDGVYEWLIRHVIVTGGAISTHSLLEQLLKIMYPGLTESILQAAWLHILTEKHTTAVKASPVIQQAAAQLISQYKEPITVLQQQLANAHRRQETSDQQRADKRKHEDNIERTVSSKEDAANNSTEDAVTKSIEEVTAGNKKSKKTDDVTPEKDMKNEPGTEQESASSNVKQGEETLPVTEDKHQQSASAEDYTTPAPPADGTVYYINNAGLILLHPYLSFCFDALELREGKEFKNEAAAHKAVQLLGYLAYGEEDIPEYDLVLPKILCGIQPATPVKRFIPLTAAEKTEADELLAAVISHWNALGNTSPDGLRGNFLMREGKLEWKEEEWQLYVTQTAYDMLLNRLPWGFSVVGLSWMPWLIKTVWT